MTTDILKDYYHQDRLGSTTNLTDKFGRVVGRADYNEWGEITYREALTITSSYRRIYPQSNYTGHDWDDVLGMYYAKARFYSAEDKRFVAMDPVEGTVTDPRTLVPYVYCADSPLVYIDPNGEVFFLVTGAIGAVLGGVVGGVTAAVKSYKETGTVNIGNVVKSAVTGAAVGGVVGLTAGAAATYVAGAVATTTAVSTVSTISTAAVVGSSKVIAGAAIGATVYGSVAAGTRSGQNGGKLKPKDLLHIGGKAIVGAMDGATVGTLTKAATALAGAKTLAQAGKAVVQTVISNPQQATTTALATANQIVSARSVDAAVERGDFAGVLPGALTYVAGYAVFSCLVDETTQSVSSSIAWQNLSNADRTLKQLTPREIASLNRQELKSMCPDGWDFQDHNNRIHIRDEAGIIRIRIDVPDKTTNYTHIHIYDEFGNPLDSYGNPVSPKDPSGHIRYSY